MSAPLIGVTLSRIQNSYGLWMQAVAQAYLDAIRQAGGLPVLLPLDVDAGDARPLWEVLNGVVFTGGGDIHPVHYETPMDAWVDTVDTGRDSMELALFAEVQRRDLPFLGICRGLQLINVALGGTLYTDVQVQHPGAHKHDFYPVWPRPYLAHPVTLALDSRLEEILGTSQVWVNSLHHQAIRQPASCLRVTALSPDGVVEAVELPQAAFGVAVQWHPEWLQAHAPMRSLFREFILAADACRLSD